jgi:hypothetical protein
MANVVKECCIHGSSVQEVSEQAERSIINSLIRYYINTCQGEKMEQIRQTLNTRNVRIMSCHPH